MRVTPIKLNRKPVLSLDQGIPDDKLRPPCPESVDGERLASCLGLDPEERRYFVATKVRGIPLRRLAAYLGWPAARVNAVRVRVQRRLKKLKVDHLKPNDFIIRGNSSFLSYREPLGNGRWAYALADLSPSFPEILLAERQEWYRARVTEKIISAASSNICGVKCSNDSRSATRDRGSSLEERPGKEAVEKLTCVLVYRSKTRKRAVVVAQTSDPKAISEVAAAALRELRTNVAAETREVLNERNAKEEAGDVFSGLSPVVCRGERAAAILEAANAGLL